MPWVFVSPATSSGVAGSAVPMPTLPFGLKDITGLLQFPLTYTLRSSFEPAPVSKPKKLPGFPYFSNFNNAPHPIEDVRLVKDCPFVLLILNGEFCPYV